MSTTYAKSQTTAQKKDAPSAASVLDASSQSESLQRKANMANNAAQRAEALRPNNTGMPDNLKSGIESLSGFSMDDVRVHYNSSKPATVQALAYTQGTDIHVAPGQEKHLPHEAWHVAQQMAGRVSPTTNINGMPVNDNAALEHEADVMGAKAVQCKKNNDVIRNSVNLTANVSQLMPGEDVDLVCAADVFYVDKTEKSKHVKGVGYNDPNDKEDVLKLFKKKGLDRLANVQKGTGTAAGDPGQCAEPHAVADAIKNIEDEDCSRIEKIYVSDSVVRKKINENVTSFPIHDDGYISTYSRCTTCAQWIQNDNYVKPSYLVRKGDAEKETEDISGIATSDTSKYRTNSTLWKYDKDKSCFCEKEFKNIHFLDKLDKSSGIFSQLADDVEAKNIDNQEGLRTIIKKRLLKNRALELELQKDEIYKSADTLIKILQKILDLLLEEKETSKEWGEHDSELGNLKKLADELFKDDSENKINKAINELYEGKDQHTKRQCNKKIQKLKSIKAIIYLNEKNNEEGNYKKVCEEIDKIGNSEKKVVEPLSKKFKPSNE